MQEHHRVLCLGQVISLFITVTSVCTQELTLNYNVHLATTQSVGNYLLLIGYLVYRWWMRDESSSGTPWWKYTLLAFADVEANFLVVLAYKYTTISSAMLLDCFTLPVVMFLSITFLHAKYSTQHYTGVGLCLFGICFLVVSDIINCKDASFTSDSFNTTALFGDALSLLGATIYGVSNVAQEYFVKTKSRVQVHPFFQFVQVTRAVERIPWQPWLVWLCHLRLTSLLGRARQFSGRFLVRTRLHKARS
ncbi:hypothetical protein, variant 2 [Aphanomyces invadans]|uniref:EamA domain-containing protein n=1 Tax=Aphanomyces invadans TaxID=157072 RepID=A0A024TVE3_9STRA|nr:hypothetical protein, variant 2 [Aphanomyces invadans]ETV97924.1 hypothetical protein, variant 2 [Aphanomyces invadans]|eukprot:XP_008873485.1 hypothetical protein, variant 2 [Aphanomyces invadans]